MKLKIKPLREGVKLPVRANPTDAGLDVFWNPIEKDIEALKKLRKSKSTLNTQYLSAIHSWGGYGDHAKPEMNAWIESGENIVLRVGFAVEFPAGYAMEVKNRSSMGSKRSLVVGAHLIDSSYRGEIFIDLHNIGKEVQVIKEGDKIAQLVIYPIETPEYEIVEELSDTVRGEGGFGSTGS